MRSSIENFFLNLVIAAVEITWLFGILYLAVAAINEITTACLLKTSRVGIFELAIAIVMLQSYFRAVKQGKHT